MDKLDILQKLLDIKIKNRELFNIALIHKSWAVEHKKDVHNERLEFLGDSVLAVIVAEYLYKTFPDKDEGELSKIKSVLVSKIQLARWAKQIKLDEYVLISKSEEKSGGRKKESILASVFEAILGAMYLDIGIEECRKFMYKNFLFVTKEVEIQDYKSVLQEIVQKRYKKLPQYTIVKENGPDHDKEFDCVVKIDEQVLGFGIGKTKKQAQQNAAKQAVEKLKKII
jgi:ribonuclease-3